MQGLNSCCPSLKFLFDAAGGLDDVDHRLDGFCAMRVLNNIIFFCYLSIFAFYLELMYGTAGGGGGGGASALNGCKSLSLSRRRSVAADQDSRFIT